jgi:hypothetical protein
MRRVDGQRSREGAGEGGRKAPSSHPILAAKSHPTDEDLSVGRGAAARVGHPKLGTICEKNGYPKPRFWNLG